MSGEPTCARCGTKRPPEDMACTWSQGKRRWWCHPGLSTEATCYMLASWGEPQSPFDRISVSHADEVWPQTDGEQIPMVDSPESP